MTIRLSIDRIVLDPAAAAGADPRDLRAALEGGLVQLVSAEGVQPFLGRSAVIERIEAGPLQIAAPGSDQLGAGLAHTLYTGLTR